MKRTAPVLLVIHILNSPMSVDAQTPGEASASTPLTNSGGTPPSLAKCLPPDIKLGDIVNATSSGYAKGQAVEVHKVTVEQRLNELKATCDSDNKLVDGSGRRIVFYHLTGCWGNPPQGYQNILQKQQEEINKLKEQYTVIEMTCNPSGVPIS
jgi:hypothetical protein